MTDEANRGYSCLHIKVCHETQAIKTYCTDAQ